MLPISRLLTVLPIEIHSNEEWFTLFSSDPQLGKRAAKKIQVCALPVLISLSVDRPSQRTPFNFYALARHCLNHSTIPIVLMCCFCVILSQAQGQEMSGSATFTGISSDYNAVKDATTFSLTATFDGVVNGASFTNSSSQVNITTALVIPYTAQVGYSSPPTISIPGSPTAYGFFRTQPTTNIFNPGGREILFTIYNQGTMLWTCAADDASPNVFVATATDLNASGNAYCDDEILTHFSLHAHIGPSKSTVEAVDPLPDLVQTGYVVVTDPDILSNGGRFAQGVAADGVAQVLIRIPSSAPGETFELKIQEADVPTKLGALGPIGTNPCASQGVNDISVVSQALQSGQAEAFALYCAPTDYAYGPDSDSGTATRSIHIRITSTSGSSPDQTLELKVVRPLVAFVHGYNADSSAWDSFIPLLPSYTSTIGAFVAVDYGYKIGYPTTNPPLPSLAPYTPFVLPPVKHSHIGFTANARVALDGIETALDTYRKEINLAGVPIAAAQVDVVGHSMGGLVARTLPVAPGTRADYYSATNYGNGLIHKLITLGTPHLGTPQALSALNPANNCSSGLVALKGTYAFFQVNGENGATNDLQGDGTGAYYLSDALRNLSSDMPIAYGAGEVGTRVGDVAGALFHLARSICGSYTTLFPTGIDVLGLLEGFGNIYHYGEPTADRFTPERWSTQFDPNVLLTAPSKAPTLFFPVEGPGAYDSGLMGSSVSTPNDASVPLTSGLNHLTDADPTIMVFRNTVHSPGWNSAGFTGPNLQNSQEAAHWVDSLLNAPVSDPRFHKP